MGFFIGESPERNNFVQHTLYEVIRIYTDIYPDCGVSWKKIVDAIYDSIEHIQIKVVNSDKRRSEKLVYPQNESVRVIAIGGLALSRGLTLEGLITSYFYRNTSTYDVLMQMGRWFGYRKNYDDLFRIWTAKSSAEWYAEIAEATERLKIDIRITSYNVCYTKLLRIFDYVLLFGAFFAKKALTHWVSELLYYHRQGNYPPTAKMVKCVVSVSHRQRLLSGIK